MLKILSLLLLLACPSQAQQGTLFLSGGDIIGPNVVDIGAMLPPADPGNTRVEITTDIGWQNEWCFETGEPGFYSVDLNPVNGWSLDLGWDQNAITLMSGRAASPHLSVQSLGAWFDGTLDWQGSSSFCGSVSAVAPTRSVTFTTNLLGLGQPLLLRMRSGAYGPVVMYQSSPQMWNLVRNTWGASVQYRYLP